MALPSKRISRIRCCCQQRTNRTTFIPNAIASIPNAKQSTITATIESARPPLLTQHHLSILRYAKLPHSQAAAMPRLLSMVIPMELR